ncbi:leucine Rich repeat-containing domain protein [Trichuris suis]|nr:leucine Rich repeat-containing domain protein [Trichuris suis]
MLLSFPQMALLLSAVRLIGIADLLDEQAMVKLTSQLIENALQYINACRDRELVLRGYKIPVIENLGATHDQFDTIDFTNNDLKRIENFPTLRRVKSLFFTNNRISGLDSSVAESLPNLKTLVLTNNVFEELGDLEPLASFPKLEYLSLMGNPVTHKPMYRLFVIFTVPQVRVLDYKRVRAAERVQANTAFKGEGAAAIKEQIVKSAPPANIPEVVNGQELRTASEIRSIKEAINKAKTIEEVNRLKAALEAGVLPDAPMEVVSEDASLTCN